MPCARCHGLMVRETVGSHPTKVRTPLELWRCLICGHRADWTIDVNRWQSLRRTPARAREQLAQLFQKAALHAA